jgi:arylsulfatase A-like enzyme
MKNTANHLKHPRHFPVLMLMAILLLSVGSCRGLKQQEDMEGKRPNIILIMADDLGYEALGCYGSAEYKTPNLDRMAAEGMLFTHAYANPLCTPSRVKIMTGLYNNRNYEGFGILRPGEFTIGHLGQRAGYATFIAGKWQLSLENRGHEPETHPHVAGFDEYCLWQIRPGDYWQRFKDPVVRENGRFMENLQGRYGPDVYTEAITEFIKRNRKNPFLVYFPMCLVHRPFQPTPDNPEYEDTEVEGFTDTTYFGDMVNYMDKLVGRIKDKLVETGLAEKTLIMFTGDNGTDREVWSEMTDGQVIKGWKGFPVEHGTHVPLIAYWKGTIDKGKVWGSPVDFSDFLPTLADAMETSIPDSVTTDGISFYDHMLGRAAPARKWVFCHYHSGKEQFPEVEYVHDGQWKLYADGRFYHVAIDPLEEHPVSNDELTEKLICKKQEFQTVLDSLLQ